MHQQLWGYKVEWKIVSRGTGGKKLNTTALDQETELAENVSRFVEVITPTVLRRLEYYFEEKYIFYSVDETGSILEPRGQTGRSCNFLVTSLFS
jgi:hypothetical protein